MNSNRPTRPHLELPDSVQGQLNGFARRLRLVETAFAVIGGACGLALTYLVLFLSDRLWDTPVWCRFLLAAVGTLGVAGFAVFWGRRWLWRRRDERQFAEMVQRHYPRLGDRLLGIVELADETRRPPNVSPALCRAAMRQVAAEAAKLDFQKAAPTRNTRLSAAVLAGIACVVLVGLFFVPAAGRNAFERWLRPLASIPRYTLVQLEQLAGKRVVPYGEAFELDGALKPTSRWLPRLARGRFERQTPIQASVESGRFAFRIPGQTREGFFSFRIGDAHQRVAIVPTFRPELTELRADIELPEYLGYPAVRLDARTGVAEAVEGSRMRLTGKVSRPLRTATIEKQPLTVERDEFHSGPLAVEESRRLALEWEDALGLRSKTPFVLSVGAKKDQAPVVDCHGLTPVVAMLVDEVLKFEVWGEDDFGVRRLSVVWEGEGDSERHVAPIQDSAVITNGAHQAKRLTGSFRFAPAALDIEPQLITLRALAMDHFPDREPSRSPAYRIYVLDHFRHAQLLQKQFETLQGKLEEIARAEEGAHEINERLKELSPEELATAETSAQLRAQEQAEEANAERLARLQAELMKLIKEALRNKTIPESVLREWAKLLETIQPLPRDLMPQVSKSLGKAQKSAEQRAERLAEAIAQQKEVLERLLRALQELNEANEQLQASNFVNRLRQAAGAETEIGSSLQQMLPQSAGMSAGQLPESLKLRLRKLHDKQANTQNNVRYIRDDLGHFVKRARQEKYAEVHQEMEKSRVVEELEKLAGLVGDNLGAQAIEQSGRWATQLTAWADMLGKQAGGGGQGDGGGQMSPEAIELMLKLARIRQQEQELREATRFLEERKESLPLYGESATRLGRIQDNLGEQIRKISDRYSSPQLAALLEQVNAAMGDAAQLLYKPQTDGETIAAETEVIELLSAACEGAGGGGGSSGIMAMLMQMLGMGAGTSGGGSTQGGTTDQPATGTQGATAGAQPDPRHVDKATGRSEAALPAEFREALEGYFETMEQMK